MNRFKKDLMKTINNVYEILLDKNKGYGNSFYETLDLVKENFGNIDNEHIKNIHYIGFLQREYDKFKRFINLLKNQPKENEKIKDAVFDLVGYGLLFLNYLNKENDFEK